MKSLLYGIGTCLGLLLFQLNGYSQEEFDLFSDQEPLEIKMKFSIKELRKQTNDSTYMDHYLQLKNEETGEWESLDIEMRVRGNFRLENCFYPPLRVKVKKKQAKGTIFDGNRNLKLVIPCTRSNGADSDVVKEYLCYKLFEPITPYTFQTRLVKVYFENEDDKKDEVEELVGFFIEDDDNVADRFGGEILEGKKIVGTLLEDSAAVRHDYFQLMIGNTDWSTMFQHNMKILKLDSKTVVPLAYDFDMTGIVNPPYSQVSNLVDIEHVTERLYRGYCREESLMQAIRQEFLELEPEIWARVEAHEGMMDKPDYRNFSNYLQEFFNILEDDRIFESQILMDCRK
ncbi:hypothetical protein JYB62_08430 [Algoriphagus lutimaris]|uniref:hypothetical protein n=1 Tax=Algoriphagus lutimaris TaxID=613197 RepID=UPI00196ADC1D|nr:hypothetical protein [Algoriphagus lutimaris]MBN3520028.1 hypothetical protein [Algoriphagus lutimaris]